MSEPSYKRWWQDHRSEIETADDVRIDLFVRSLGAPTATQRSQEHVVERLDELEESERIDRFTVQVWGDRIYPEERCAKSSVGRYLRNKIAEFQQWAEREDEISLPFESSVCAPFVADQEFRCITLPQIAAATYLDGELSAVLPATFGNQTLSVHDYLSALADLQKDPLEARDRSVSPPTVEGA